MADAGFSEERKMPLLSIIIVFFFVIFFFKRKKKRCVMIGKYKMQRIFSLNFKIPLAFKHYLNNCFV